MINFLPGEGNVANLDRYLLVEQNYFHRWKVTEYMDSSAVLTNNFEVPSLEFELYATLEVALQSGGTVGH